MRVSPRSASPLSASSRSFKSARVDALALWGAEEDAAAQQSVDEASPAVGGACSLAEDAAKLGVAVDRLPSDRGRDGVVVTVGVAEARPSDGSLFEVEGEQVERGCVDREIRSVARVWSPGGVTRVLVGDRAPQVPGVSHRAVGPLVALHASKASGGASRRARIRAREELVLVERVRVVSDS